MKTKASLLLVLLLLGSACKKKTIETLPPSNSPVFYVKGILDGNPIDYHAGVNGMAMSSGFESRNGVEYAYANFSDGLTTYKMGMFDGNTSLPNDMHDIQVGDTLFFAQKPTQILAYISVSQFSNYFMFSDVQWRINGQNIAHENVSIMEPGVYDIEGKFTFNDGIQRTISNRLYLGFKDDTPLSIHHFLSDPDQLKLWIEGNTQDVDSVQWYFDNELKSTGESCTQMITPEIKTIKAKVYYHNSAVQERLIVVDGSFGGRYVEDFSVFKAPDQNTFWDYLVGLEVEKDGDLYSTFNVSNYKGNFVVKSKSVYTHPSTGKQLTKIEADLDAKLKSMSTGKIIESKINTVFGFPYP